jgi:MtN3 and saliva related transmembrane protein
MKSADWIGWMSSVILLTTLIRQVYTQWQSGEAKGVSRWLFVGQLCASTGFTVYSFLLHNWIFASSNIAILGTAVAGEVIYLRNKRRQNNH